MFKLTTREEARQPKVDMVRLTSLYQSVIIYIFSLPFVLGVYIYECV
jgi:hypothetical protein